MAMALAIFTKPVNAVILVLMRVRNVSLNRKIKSKILMLHNPAAAKNGVALVNQVT